MGDRLTVEMQGHSLIARRGNADVARFSNTRPELLAAVAASCGVAKGTVLEFHELAGVAEIALC